MLGLDFHAISMFLKITHGSFLFMEKSLLMEKSWPWKNQKWKKVLSEKQIKKRKNSFVKVTGACRAPHWHPDFEQRSCCQTEICYTWCQNEVSFYLMYEITSLDTKMLTIALNHNFESCQLLVLLLSTFSGYSIFAMGFSFAFSNFAHYFVWILNAPLRDQDKKTLSAMGCFPRKSWSIVIDTRSLSN